MLLCNFLEKLVSHPTFGNTSPARTVTTAGLARSSQSAARTKLRATAWALRLLSLGYLGSVLWHIQNWWLDGERVTRLLGAAYGQDLGSMLPWQRLAAMGIDLVAYAVLVVAVVYGWRFLGSLLQQNGFSETGVAHLLRCAGWGLGCELLSLVSRPFKSYVLTLHLNPADQQWRWSLQSGDVLTVMFCTALLLCALMSVWTLEIAEENRSFV